MSEITPGEIEGFVEVALSIRCANCGINEERAIGDLYDIENLTEELCDTCTGNGWKYGVVGDNQGVFCADCINGKNNE